MILDFKLRSKKTEKIETSIWFMQIVMYCFSTDLSPQSCVKSLFLM